MHENGFSHRDLKPAVSISTSCSARFERLIRYVLIECPYQVAATRVLVGEARRFWYQQARRRRKWALDSERHTRFHGTGTLGICEIYRSKIARLPSSGYVGSRRDCCSNADRQADIWKFTQSGSLLHIQPTLPGSTSIPVLVSTTSVDLPTVTIVFGIIDATGVAIAALQLYHMYQQKQSRFESYKLP